MFGTSGDNHDRILLPVTVDPNELSTDTRGDWDQDRVRDTTAGTSYGRHSNN